jgi:hypothetical protein
VSCHRLKLTTGTDKPNGNPFSFVVAKERPRVARHFNSRNSYHDDWRHALRYFLYDFWRENAGLDTALQGNILLSFRL